MLSLLCEHITVNSLNIVGWNKVELKHSQPFRNRPFGNGLDLEAVATEKWSWFRRRPFRERSLRDGYSWDRHLRDGGSRYRPFEWQPIACIFLSWAGRELFYHNSRIVSNAVHRDWAGLQTKRRFLSGRLLVFEQRSLSERSLSDWPSLTECTAPHVGTFRGP